MTPDFYFLSKKIELIVDIMNTHMLDKYNNYLIYGFLCRKIDFNNKSNSDLLIVLDVIQNYNQTQVDTFYLQSAVFKKTKTVKKFSYDSDSSQIIIFSKDKQLYLEFFVFQPYFQLLNVLKTFVVLIKNILSEKIMITSNSK